MNAGDIVKEIDTLQKRAVCIRAANGYLRELELLWGSLLREHHGFKIVPAFTARQRGNLKDMRDRYGDHTKPLIEFAVRNWVNAVSRYTFLPPAPVFDALYYHREKFDALLISNRLNHSQGNAAAKKIEGHKKEASDKHMSLMDMVIIAQNKIREKS